MPLVVNFHLSSRFILSSLAMPVYISRSELTTTFVVPLATPIPFCFVPLILFHLFYHLECFALLRSLHAELEQPRSLSRSRRRSHLRPPRLSLEFFFTPSCFWHSISDRLFATARSASFTVFPVKCRVVTGDLLGLAGQHLSVNCALHALASQ